MSRYARRVFDSEGAIVARPGGFPERPFAQDPHCGDATAGSSLMCEVRGLTTIPHLPRTMAKAPPAPTDAPLPASYEEALAELERLVASMEGGQLPLDALLGSYRRGAELLNFCRSRLEAVETQVRLLEDGQLKPWGDA
jgi:exodeoxyribonuclease VII small subunit